MCMCMCLFPSMPRCGNTVINASEWQLHRSKSQSVAILRKLGFFFISWDPETDRPGEPVAVRLLPLADAGESAIPRGAQGAL